MSKVSLVTFMLLSMLSCQVNKALSDNEVYLLGQEWFSGKFTIDRNVDNTYALLVATQKASMESPVRTTEFGILDLKSKQLVYRESVNDGQVNWRDTFSVEVKNKAGVYSTNDAQNRNMSSYTIDARTLEKRFNQTTD